jgi:hypothetical protein
VLGIKDESNQDRRESQSNNGPDAVLMTIKKDGLVNSGKKK